MKKPLIAIPIGDCAGVGPEITVKALVSSIVMGSADCIVIGSSKILEKAIELTEVKLKINTVEDPANGDYREGILNLIDIDNIDMGTFRYGVVQAMCGKAAYDYIEKSIELALSGKADAVATTPINKEALHAAGVPFIGHTEIFGKLTDTEDPLTMFETNGLRVFFLTRHLSMQQMHSTPEQAMPAPAIRSIPPSMIQSMMPMARKPLMTAPRSGMTPRYRPMMKGTPRKSSR